MPTYFDSAEWYAVIFVEMWGMAFQRHNHVKDRKKACPRTQKALWNFQILIECVFFLLPASTLAFSPKMQIM